LVAFGSELRNNGVASERTHLAVRCKHAVGTCSFNGEPKAAA
jgi:hypothetical protein